MFNSVLVTERSRLVMPWILEPVMGHMSGLRRADGGGEAIEEGEGGRGGLLFCPSCELIETTVSSVDRARTNGIFDVGGKEGKFVANWMEISVIWR